MKKIILVSAGLLLCTVLSAKKVKFAVDMTGQTINPTGIHVTGDFQTLAGFPGGDWQANTTALTQELPTDVYSIIVDIPAFAKYEYKFVNGDQSYEVEFVPVESRVGYNFDDNRWIYVDSLADDTTFVGAILFSANAPAGLTLARFVVDMQNEPSVSPAGVHVAGNFQGWDTSQIIMYSFTTDVFEIISYVTAGVYQYRYFNGNSPGTEENVPIVCSVNSNREDPFTSDIVLPLVCFSNCTACPVGIQDEGSSKIINLSPNPANEYTVLNFKNNTLHTIILTDVSGRIIRSWFNYSFASLRIYRNNLDKGIYFITVQDDKNNFSTAKLVIE